MSEDPQKVLLRQRAQLVRQFAGDFTRLIEQFATELIAVDDELGTLQRHNVQQTAAATTVSGYETLARQVQGLVDGESRDVEELATLLRALQAQLNGLQEEVRVLVREREAGGGDGV